MIGIAPTATGLTSNAWPLENSQPSASHRPLRERTITSLARARYTNHEFFAPQHSPIVYLYILSLIMADCGHRADGILSIPVSGGTFDEERGDWLRATDFKYEQGHLWCGARAGKYPFKAKPNRAKRYIRQTFSHWRYSQGGLRKVERSSEFSIKALFFPGRL